MERNLDTRIEAYLDGTLGPDETRAFEADLATPAVSRAFSEALLIRTLFRAPVDLPEGLVDRVAKAIGAAAREAVEAPETGRRSTVRSVLGSFRWAVRGPALAIPPRSGSGSLVRSGMGTIRYALAPVDAVRSAAGKGADKKTGKRPWWLRVWRRK